MQVSGPKRRKMDSLFGDSSVASKKYLQTIYDCLANHIEYRGQSPMNPGGEAVVLMSRRLNLRRRTGM